MWFKPIQCELKPILEGLLSSYLKKIFLGSFGFMLLGLKILQNFRFYDFLKLKFAQIKQIKKKFGWLYGFEWVSESRL
jgi:hypothetical protein